jgi:hypothetical protein
VYIVGNALTEQVREFAGGSPYVRHVGWVPSVFPYLDRARVSVIPLRYGAGTKRKLLQALMLGTPTVTTTTGAEGLHLTDDRHVLIADDPGEFADSIERLLTNKRLWNGLAVAGRKHICARHGHEAAKVQLLRTIESLLAKPAKSAVGVNDAESAARAYTKLVERVSEAACEVTPMGATIAVVSKGDDALLRFAGRTGWHFPRQSDGTYTGHYPADSDGAIQSLETARTAGAQYLVIPQIAEWWLTHYGDFASHLRRRYREVERREGVCTIFDLSGNRRKPHRNGIST